MGISGFFRQILERYSKTHGWDDERVDYFLVDFNSIIYEVAHKIDETGMNAERYQAALINGVLDQVKTLVELIKPRRGVYLALDGPAPVAKMVTQRERRFKEIKQQRLLTEIGLGHKVKEAEEKLFDRRLISPGTLFMEDLSRQLKAAIEVGRMTAFLTKKERKGFEFILSDTHVPGEGEHKIMPFLRKLGDKSATVYSPDADMLILGLISGATHLKILKTVKKGDPEVLVDLYSDKGFVYVYMSVFREAMVRELGIKGMDPQRVVYDYAYIVSMTGNDFVIPVDYLQTRKGGPGQGLNRMIEVYQSVMSRRKTHLVIPELGRIRIDVGFFLEMLEQLAASELNDFQQLQRQRDRMRKTRGISEREKAKYAGLGAEDVLMQKFEHMDFARPDHPLHKMFASEFDKINFYDRNWREQYYAYYLEIEPYEVPRFAALMSINYLESLQFTMDYYLYGCPNYHWYNRFDMAPLMSDLRDYVKANREAAAVFDIKSGAAPLNALEQMAVIMPPDMIEYLPKGLAELMTSPDSLIIDQYPTDFKMEVFSSAKWIYSKPRLPPLALKRVLKEIKKVVLSEMEATLVAITEEPWIKRF